MMTQTTANRARAIELTRAAIARYHQAQAHVQDLADSLEDGPERRRWMDAARYDLRAAEMGVIYAIHTWNDDLDGLGDLDCDGDLDYLDWSRGALIADGKLYTSSLNEYGSAVLTVLDATHTARDQANVLNLDQPRNA